MDKKEYDKLYSRKYRKENAEWKKQSNREYRLNNLEKVKGYKYNKRYKHYSYKEYAREWHRERRKSNLQYRLSRNISNTIYLALKEKKAGRKWEQLVGYTLIDLMNHLEKQFETWMSWSNYGEWHIDHIKAKSLFNYTCPEDKEFQECWALSNLQPLEKIENLKKGIKVV